MVIKISPKALNKAVLFLKSGGVIVCPTDTVYGFLADAQNKKAVDTIYKIKKRPKFKPLPVFVKDLKMAKELAEVSNEQTKTLRKYWPGKYTFVLKRKIEIKLYGVAKDTVAIRIPKYKFLNNVLKKINRPLAQTSVNISNKSPLNNIEDIRKFIENIGRLGLQILVIDGGSLKKTRPSKVIDISSHKTNIVRK